MDWAQALAEGTTGGRLLSSLLLLLAVLFTYRLASLSIRRTPWASADIRRRWLVMARNLAILLFLLGLVVIWAAQLRTLAVSVVGFAVAIVLVTKELLMCMTGGLLRSGAGSFRVGDRIVVKGLRGEVVDFTMLTTTILEIGPDNFNQQHSGRAIVLPNALFLTEPVINESYTEQFVLQCTLVPLKRDQDWQRHEQALLGAARELCAEYLEPAREHMNQLSRRLGIEPPAVEPRVSLHLPKPDELHLLARYPVPAGRSAHAEQRLLRHYLEQSREQRERNPPP
ncbi:mechanosensitive ion channel domain-containing protein [Alkalilimnicola sp. S0819]|uniref:mechanosensitive ion channel domain-containing protein n=1 Tax=Alkalilimnicola sp. S0819 TaxID=2613922 RepID=UPI001261837E|nr:mechanosensitive ion channel domain-containing protein [Alkalilimnicola sp. S0819]KAB7627668.1 mechanosensitive ion channel [Alkalilimnicola sp. S0819]MPQ15835.1 mechanosensitive ion channel [Alkalilimnicola sp. S0819]